MKRLKHILFLMLLLWSSGSYAQNDWNQKELMTQLKIGELNDFISRITDKSLDENNLNEYIDKATQLFLGKGESFKIEGREAPGVSVTLISNHGKTVRYPIKKYLTRLKLLSDVKVEVVSVDICQIDSADLKKVEDGGYACITFIKQKSSYRDGKLAFSDGTKKKAGIFIGDPVDGIEDLLLLGDVVVWETE